MESTGQVFAGQVRRVAHRNPAAADTADSGRNGSANAFDMYFKTAPSSSCLRVSRIGREPSAAHTPAAQPQRKSRPPPVAAVCDRRGGAKNRTKHGGHRPPLQQKPTFAEISNWVAPIWAKFPRVVPHRGTTLDFEPQSRWEARDSDKPFTP